MEYEEIKNAKLVIEDMFESYRTNVSTELTGERKEAVEIILKALNKRMKN